jgi:hypothetical protein
MKAFKALALLAPVALPGATLALAEDKVESKVVESTFDNCVATIDQYSRLTGLKSVTFTVKSNQYVVAFHVSDGTVLVTCDRLPPLMTMQMLPKN